MKYKLIGSNDYWFDLKTTIANNRGVQNLQELINVDKSNLNDNSLFANIKEASNCLIRHIKNDNKIHIIVDSDCDGYTSASIMYNYIKNIAPNIRLSYSCHKGKEHGIMLPELESYQFDLLIVPDAGTNDVKAHEILANEGKDIIVLDHHPIELNVKYATIVNCNDNTYPNKNLSGSGVVYQFCKYVDKILQVNYADNYLDLTAVGLIGDMMDSRILENRYLMYTGIKNIRNNFLSKLIEKQLYNKSITITNIAFYVVPVINAVCRVGTFEEKSNLFEALVNTNAQIDYTNSKTKQTKLVYLYEDMARQVVNIKSRQKREQEKIISSVIDNIDNEQPILFILDDLITGDYTGLIANDIAGRYFKPTIVLRPDENPDFYRGSGRGYDKHIIQNLRTEINNSKIFTFAQGHEQAFGVKIHKNNVPKAIEYFTNKFKNIDNNKFYFVDFEFKSPKEVNKKLIEAFEEMKELYGQNFTEPYILVSNVECDIDTLFINENKTVLKFSYGEIDYTLFLPNEKQIQDFNNNCTLNVIGKAGINSFAGKTYYQIIIDDYEILCYNISNTKKDENWF